MDFKILYHTDDDVWISFDSTVKVIKELKYRYRNLLIAYNTKKGCDKVKV